ncbi:MAG: sigma factor-like helix-turn-helix DNA-binding protein [Microbacteriaceae bacterium]
MTEQSAPPVRVRLALLEEQALLLDGLRSWITEHAPDFEVVLGARSWLELVLSDRFPTQLVMLDFQPRERVSFEAQVRTCRAARAKVIVVSAFDDPSSQERASRAGAAAFVSRRRPFQELMDVARRVMGLSRPLLAEAEPAPVPPRLSAGEREALRLYVSGLSTAEVAERMDVRYETVKTYLRRVREKYARVDRPASSKAELVRRAAEDGHLS